ncbi:hypothetical protein GCM10010156_48810 [Planobispora rosea]|uniref:RNA polymerase sigma-70 region 4 domain-containing protein n=1 Tax=Planobispora rosea TaxID=35762 RepID=A0A8J3S2B9_PLARO|nr:sigma-70 family RNA polymerase sigma factor [Planobispora rosea]GGS84443.1 hypothetical protein GCM10010156_48810 [Planobispora rosea]GIH86392.1 hypothetical protein Pro02_48000 [Planobispora rosea]
MHIDVSAVLAEIHRETDLIQRIRRVGDVLSEIDVLTAELGRIRLEDIETLTSRGMSQNEIGRQTNLSSARISQLRKGGPPRERAFFGARDGMVITAVAEKQEAGKARPGPVVSIDDLQAYDRLRRLLEDLKLKSTYEIVQPPGEVRLNRDGLVLICGPRHSPLIAQVLEADDHLAFAQDPGGWHLVDRITGQVYRSPEDQGEPGDIAYFGRLPRPDGKGTFLYLAGIHAAGAAGVIHYLETALVPLYQQVRTRRFSMLISCRYDPDTHQIISSEQITPTYKHEG